MRLVNLNAMLGFALASLAILAAADDARGAYPASLHESRSVSGFETERGTAERRDPDLLEMFQAEASMDAGVKDGLPASRKHSVVCCAFRVFDARVQLFDDFDMDGYHSYFRVTFDVDTDYADADVFARLFLRGPTGVWNLFYETGVYSIYGSVGSDDYEVETELVAGYPTGDYDLLIEVYEAYYGDLVVDYGPWDTSALGYLPLEDIGSDGLVPPPVAVSRGGGGGALSAELLVLAGLAGWGLRRRREALSRPAV